MHIIYWHDGTGRGESKAETQQDVWEECKWLHEQGCVIDRVVRQSIEVVSEAEAARPE